MPEARPRLTAACQCGRTSLEIAGAPILTAICCCESCRTAGRQLEQAPGAPPVVRADGGTEYCVFRKDRVKVAAGGERLQERRLQPGSPTRRVVATCCNTPMFLDFTAGHWLSVYRGRIPGEPPAPTMRIMAKYAPSGVEFADGVATYPTVPGAFVFKLLASWAAMGFRGRRFAW
jgi:hypothetical protein